jgi:hypothetical protein
MRPYSLRRRVRRRSGQAPHAHHEGTWSAARRMDGSASCDASAFWRKARALRRSTPARLPPAGSFCGFASQALAIDLNPRSGLPGTWAPRVLPASSLSQSSELLAARSSCRTDRPRGSPSLRLRVEAAGAAHRPQGANAPNPAQTKAGAVLRAGPVWLLHFKNASRSAPHEQVMGIYG